MAPLTATQVIDSGDYLDATFDPNTLTIPVLLAIFLHHNIPYPSQHSKGKLVQLFNEEIKPNSTKLRREREKAKKKTPSNEGITDGLTGEPVEPFQAPVRRSTRRSSQTPDPQPVPPKSRSRSSATPKPASSQAVRKTFEVVEPKVEEVSESEEEEPEPKPVVKKSVARQTGRKSFSPIVEEEVSDSAWETNNPFQSGPSERDSPERPKRQGNRVKASRRTRATSQEVDRSSSPGEPFREAPPQPARRPAKNVAAQEPVAGTSRGYTPPPQRRKSAADWQAEGHQVHEIDQVNADEPEGGEGYDMSHERSGYQASEPDEFLPLNDTLEYAKLRGRASSPGAYPTEEDAEDDEDEDGDGNILGPVAGDQNAIVSRKLADLQGQGSRGQAQLSRQGTNSKQGKGGSYASRFLYFLVVMILGTTLITYKQESAFIGFCDAGSNTNLRIQELQVARHRRQHEAVACRAKFNASDPFANELCSPLPLHSPLQPNACTPCPARAICTPDSVTCHQSLILKRHPAAALSSMFDGMPGMGSVAFPPVCVEDREKLRRIGGLVVGIEGWLATTRGKRVCEGVHIPRGDGGEAKAYGLELEALRIAAKRRTTRDDHSAEELFEQAITKLEQLGTIVKAEDDEGSTYVAAVRSDFNIPCYVRVTARNAWLAHQRKFYVGLFGFLVLLWFRQRLINQAAERRVVNDLVQEALSTLQEQELDHHVDPVTTPEPFLVPAHLRDFILQSEHSPKVRQRLWEKVQKVVEGNANVRANLEEVKGEDIRVWRWVGSSTPRSRRVSFADRTQSGALLKD